MFLAQIYKGIHRNVFYFGGIFKVWVLVEANFDAVCCIDVADSNSRSLASLSFGCFLLFPFEGILSPPAVTHKYIFRAGVSNKIQQQKSSKFKETPTTAQCFAFIRPLESQPEVQLSDSSQEPLPFLSGSRSSQVSHLHQQALTQQHYGECDGIRDLLEKVVSSLKVFQVNRNAAGLAGLVQSLEDNAWKTCQSLQCIHSQSDMTRDGMVMSGITMVINIGLLSFTFLVPL